MLILVFTKRQLSNSFSKCQAFYFQALGITLIMLEIILKALRLVFLKYVLRHVVFLSEQGQRSYCQILG